MIDLYKDYHVYGPYADIKQNRKIIALRNKKTQKRTSLSYARYLLSLKLGRHLLKHEEADHINNDRSDDRIENLQILSRQQNVTKFFSNFKKKTLLIVCPFCKKEIYKSIFDTHIYKKQNQTFCSMNCYKLAKRHQINHEKETE